MSGSGAERAGVHGAAEHLSTVASAAASLTPFENVSVHGAASAPTPAGAAAAEAAPRTSHWRTDLIRIGVVLGLLAALIAFGYFMQGPIKRMGPAERCWENREIEGKLYRFNPCTGQFRLLGDVIPGAVVPGSE